MSRTAEVRLDFAGEARLFKLGLRELEAVQSECDAGPMELLRRYSEGTWRVQDLRAPIFQGLKGGGAKDSEATLVMRRNFDGRPLAEFVMVAQLVVMAAVMGVGEDEPGESQAGEGEPAPNLSREESSASPSS